MDRFYRGIETSLLGFTFLIGLGALLLPSLTGAPSRVAPDAVVLPMLTVTADP